MTTVARLVGGFSLTVDGRRTGEWPRPPARRLVQLLLVEPTHRLLRDEVERELVPNSETDRARRAVSKALSHARQVVGRDAIVADGPYLRLGGTVHTDLDDLRRALREAIDMEGGEQRRLALLAALGQIGTLLPGEPESDVLVRARLALAQLVRAARIGLAGECQSGPGGAVDGAVEVLEAAFDEDQSDEEIAIALIKALRRTGADTRAAEVYRTCKRMLVRISGTGPSMELEQTAEDLISEPLPAHAAGPLLGRSAELGRLLTVLGSAENGAGACVLVTGPAGIGKSALLAAASAAVRVRGWQTAFAAASADDHLVPYGALRGALSEALSGERAPDVLPTASVRALLRPSHRQNSARWPVAALAADIGRLLARLSARDPMLVVIDDVNRSDPATHDLIGRLSARPASSWSLLLAARSDEPARRVPSFPSAISVVDIGPLTEEAASGLARAQLESAGAPADRLGELSRLVVGWSRGNPLFVKELARQVATGSEISERGLRSVPPRVSDLLEQRLADASDAARRTLPLLALAHPHTDYALLAELTASPDSDRAVAAAVLDELVAAGVAREVAGGIQLAHPLWREAALSRVNPLRRASLHAQIADALDRIGHRELVAAGHRIAAFRAAPLVEYAEAAARAGLAAGQVARSLMADDTALQLVGPALAAFEAVPAQRRRRLRAPAFAGWLESGHIHADRLDLAGAKSAYESALGLAATDDEHAAGYSALGGIAYKQGDFAAAEAIYSRGLRMVGRTSPWPRARLLADIAWARQRQGDVEQACAGLAEAAALFSSTEDRSGLSSCLDLLSVALFSSGRVSEALETADRALAMADRSRDLRLLPTLMAHRARLLLSTGDARGAEGEALQGIEAAQRAGDRYVESVCRWLLADCLDAVGDLGGALASLGEEEAVLAELHNEVNLARCLAHQATILWRLGRRELALRTRDRARAAANRVPDARVGESVEALLASAGVAVG